MATVNSISLKRNGKPGITRGKVIPFEGAELDYAIIHGKEEGPTLLITAGVHGSEVCAIEAALRIFRYLPHAHVKGTVAILPILNVEGFKKHSVFVMPEDGKNLNRAFPGKAGGTKSEQLAHWLVKDIFPQADYYLDLHSGDATETLRPFTIFVDGNEKSQELATAFGFPYAVRSTATTMAISAASAIGLPGILVEMGAGGRFSEAQVTEYNEGIARVMKHLQMLVPPKLDEQMKSKDAPIWNAMGWLVAPIEKPRDAPVILLAKALVASNEGFWYPAARGLDGTVKAGQNLGQVESVKGNTLETVVSEKAGIDLYGSDTLYVAKGDVLACIGTPEA